MNDIKILPIAREVMALFSEQSRAAIHRLAAFLTSAKLPDLSVSHHCGVSQFDSFYEFVSSSFPRSRLAAVLVLLYEDNGRLRVLLTTRSKALRTHAGQTALPGGRMDEADKHLVETAVRCQHLFEKHSDFLKQFRETFEEVQLPLNCSDVHLIGIYEPFLSLHKLLVTPVYALLTRIELLGELRGSEREVSKIFTHPLEALLDPQLSQHEHSLVALGSEDWPYDSTYYVSLWFLSVKSAC